MEMTLKRVLITDDGVIGVLTCGNAPVCLTLEEEWKDNARSISCIPAGSYLCKRVVTPRHGETFEVMNVPGRSSILIHSGNTEADTEGCILVGKEFGKVTAKDKEDESASSKIAVLRSKETFKEFMDVLQGKESFALHVKVC